MVCCKVEGLIGIVVGLETVVCTTDVIGSVVNGLVGSLDIVVGTCVIGRDVNFDGVFVELTKVLATVVMITLVIGFEVNVSVAILVVTCDIGWVVDGLVKSVGV